MKSNRILIIIALLFAINLNVYSIEYNVDTKNKSNLVKFISSAPVEDFEGVTNKIDGYILPEDANNLYNAEVYFEVDLNSVDTGIGLRNRHMREDYLHTDKHPFTTFKGKITEVKKINDTDYDVRVSGDIGIHGISKPLVTRGVIKFIKNGININTKFSVKLTDHKIEVPQVMFLKISEEIRLELDFNLKKIQ